MPEMHFQMRWPNGVVTRSYSPSTVIESYLTVGAMYPVSDLLLRVRGALHQASERVRARYGFACSSALAELDRIEQTAGALSAQEALGYVEILAFERHAARDARAAAQDSEESFAPASAVSHPSQKGLR